MKVEEWEDKWGMSVHAGLGGTLRPTIRAPTGYVLIWGDFSQIEARMMAWLSDSEGGEERLQAFRDGRDLYSLTASQMYRVPYEDIKGKADPRRRRGRPPNWASSTEVARTRSTSGASTAQRTRPGTPYTRGGTSTSGRWSSGTGSWTPSRMPTRAPVVSGVAAG